MGIRMVKVRLFQFNQKENIVITRYVKPKAVLGCLAVTPLMQGLPAIPAHKEGYVITHTPSGLHFPLPNGTPWSLGYALKALELLHRLSQKKRLDWRKLRANKATGPYADTWRDVVSSITQTGTIDPTEPLHVVRSKSYVALKRE